MKKFLCAFLFGLLVSPFTQLAKGQDVSIDFFYNNLERGSWIEVGDYGYCWQPDAATDPKWRPYADGYWAYTEDGWTWVSYEPFGWATYHYGRWVKLADFGWVWKPGYEWGPAWVSWRFGGGYCGWAPLPPETELVYESRPLSGQIDIEFDIGPANYNFIDVRYFGEPVLRSRIVPHQQNISYVNQTVNVTNITYRNKTVYDYGPDVNVLNQYSSRPIQKLKLERQTNVDVSTAAKSGDLFKTQGNTIVVAAPPKINKPSAALAPPTVKTKVAQPKVEKGWSVAGDENAQMQLKEKIKTQDLEKIPPPPAVGGSAAPRASASSALATSPFEKGKGKGKKNKQAGQLQAGAGASPGEAAGTSASPAVPEKGKGKGKGKAKRAEQFQAGGSTSPITSPATAASASVMPGSGKRGKERPNSAGPPNPIQQDFNEPGADQKREPDEKKVPPPVGETGAKKHEDQGKGAPSPTPGPQ